MTKTQTIRTLKAMQTVALTHRVAAAGLVHDLMKLDASNVELHDALLHAQEALRSLDIALAEAIQNV